MHMSTGMQRIDKRDIVRKRISTHDHIFDDALHVSQARGGPVVFSLTFDFCGLYSCSLFAANSPSNNLRLSL